MTLNTLYANRSERTRTMQLPVALKSGRRAKQRGFLMIIYAVIVIVILGFAGLAVDAGYLQFEKRKIQAAADAAAMGALREMERSNTDLVTAGQNDSALNGFANGVDGAIVTISNPPTNGSFAGNAAAVQAVVQKPIPTYFMRAIGQSSVTISAIAIARTSTTEGSVGGCIFAMNPTASGALTLSGNITITSACGAVVNSSSSSAYSQVGNSTFSLVNGAQVGVVGPGTVGSGWTISGGGQIVNAATGATESPINIVSFSDPLANAAAPLASSFSGNPIVSNGGFSVNPNTTVNLSPGIYCGGISLNGTTNLAAGTYVLAGGGLSIGAQATVTNDAAGVMFYNTTSNSQNWGCTKKKSNDGGGISFNGGAHINLSASTTQTPCGILFFDDRSMAAQSHTINGNSASTFDGAMYFLNSQLTFAGTNQTGGYTFIVADTIKITGNSNLGNDHSTLASVNEIAPASTGGGLVQ